MGRRWPIRVPHVSAWRSSAPGPDDSAPNRRGYPAGTGSDMQVAVGLASSVSFEATLIREGVGGLRRAEPRTLQVNVGKLCNQACHHCHVDAGPKRTEIMASATAERVLEVLERNPGLRTLDLTGGAPELNPSFRRLVERG